MPKIIANRVTAQIEGDFVVFLIGMRINKFWKINKWLPAALAMNNMLKELATFPRQESGFLGHSAFGTGVTIQYWRSFEHLEAYAKSQDSQHFPAWKKFNKQMKNARGDVGIWHETYMVRAGEYENVYSGMPAMGLGAIAHLQPATGKLSTAEQRVEAQKLTSP